MGSRTRAAKKGEWMEHELQPQIYYAHWTQVLHGYIAHQLRHLITAQITYLRSGKVPPFAASPKPENDLDLGRVAPTCGTKFGREIGAAGTLPFAAGSCVLAGVVTDRRGSLSGEVPLESALAFELVVVSFALLGGAPRIDARAPGTAELLRAGAGTVAARVGGAGGTCRKAVAP